MFEGLLALGILALLIFIGGVIDTRTLFGFTLLDTSPFKKGDKVTVVEHIGEADRSWVGALLTVVAVDGQFVTTTLPSPHTPETLHTFDTGTGRRCTKLRRFSPAYVKSIEDFAKVLTHVYGKPSYGRS